LGYLLMVTDALIDEADDWGGILLNSIGWIPEHIPVCAAKQSAVIWPLPYESSHRYFFLLLLLVRRNQKDRIMIRFAKWRAGESFWMSIWGTIPGCITTGCDQESHRAAYNWPSVVRIRGGFGQEGSTL
jgi:hypothetical protein